MNLDDFFAFLMCALLGICGVVLVVVYLAAVLAVILAVPALLWALAWYIIN